MADEKEREVMNLLKECISDIEECQADVIGGIAFKYNGVTYRLKYDNIKEGVTIVSIGKVLSGIFSNPYDEGWNFNFADVGMKKRNPVCIELVPENSEELKEYLDALA